MHELPHNVRTHGVGAVIDCCKSIRACWLTCSIPSWGRSRSATRVTCSLTDARNRQRRSFAALSISPTDVTARDLFAQIDQQQTKTPEHFLAISLQNYNEEKYEESIAAAQSALTLKPDYAEAFNNICAANNRLGRYEAVKACEQALRIKPDFDLARDNLQYACARKSDQ